MANTNINRASILNLDSSTAGTVLAKGTTVERPSSSIPDGAFRFNTTLNKLEYYDGSNWYTIDDEAAAGSTITALNNFDTTLYTGNNSQQSIGGYIKGAGNFNGTTSYINIPSGIYSAITGPFTLSAWINTTSSGSYKIIIGMGGVNGVAAKGLTMWMDSSGLLYASWGNGSAEDYWSVSPTTPLNTGAWFHVAITVDGLTNPVVKGYVNGVAEGSGSTGTDSITFDTSFTIGARDMGGTVASYWDGSIDQVRIYNSELSATDITNLYNETASTATTAAYPSGKTATATYTMDTSANGLLTTTDLSTVNYPAGAGCIALYEMNNTANDTSGTYDGTPTSITYESGCFDQAAVFNGSSSEITASSFASLSQVGISMWVNMPNISQQAGLIARYGTYREFAIYMYSGTLTASIYYNGNNGNATQVTASTYMSNNTWHHIAYTANGSTAPKLYIDGTEVGTPQYTDATRCAYYTSSEPLDIGHFAGIATYNYEGLIDQVRIFNTALSASNVTTLARGIATSYSGANNNVTFNGFLNFQPDLVWIKVRSAAGYNHNLYDTIRGATYRLMSNLPNAQDANGKLISFDSYGFSLSAGGDANPSQDMVSWNWKAGGAAVSNNNGTLTSTVNVNQSAGFSIVKYTPPSGGSVYTNTVGHGLSSAPEIIIQKATQDNSAAWYVHTSLIDGSNDYLVLNTDAGKVDNSHNFAVTSTTFTDWGWNGNEIINYCWHSVEGYSKIGTYPGDGNATGPTVTTGFEPSWLMIKRTDTSGEWNIFDNKRDTSNPRNVTLWAQSDDSESTASQGYIYDVDFLANGFQIKNTYSPFNNSSGTYLYMTFA